MKVAIKLLFVGFLFAGSGLLEAANTIKNTTTSAPFGHAWVFNDGSTSSSVPAAFNPGASLTIPSSCSAVKLALNCNKRQSGSGTLISTSLQPNTSYNLVLASDNKTLQLVAV